MTEFGMGGENDYYGADDPNTWQDHMSYDSSGRQAPDILPTDAYEEVNPYPGTAYDTGSQPAIREPDLPDTGERIVPLAFRHNDARESKHDYASHLPRELFDQTGNPGHETPAAENKPAENEPARGLFRLPPYGNFETDSRHHGYDMEARTSEIQLPQATHGYEGAEEPAPRIPDVPLKMDEPGVYYSEHAYRTQGSEDGDPQYTGQPDQYSEGPVHYAEEPARHTAPPAPEYQAESVQSPERDFMAEAEEITRTYNYELSGNARDRVITAIARGLEHRAKRASQGQGGVPQPAPHIDPAQQQAPWQPETTQYPPAIYEEPAPEVRSPYVDLFSAFTQDPLGAPLPNQPPRPASLEDAQPSMRNEPRNPTQPEVNYVDIPLPPGANMLGGDLGGQLPPDPRMEQEDAGLGGFVAQAAEELRLAEASGNVDEGTLQMMRERLTFLQGNLFGNIEFDDGQ